jgi:hypothetical protein
MGKGPGEESGLGPSEHGRRGTPFQACPFSFETLGLMPPIIQYSYCQQFLLPARCNENYINCSTLMNSWYCPCLEVAAWQPACLTKFIL